MGAEVEGKARAAVKFLFLVAGGPGQQRMEGGPRGRDALTRRTRRDSE